MNFFNKSRGASEDDTPVGFTRERWEEFLSEAGISGRAERAAMAHLMTLPAREVAQMAREAKAAHAQRIEGTGRTGRGSMNSVTDRPDETPMKQPQIEQKKLASGTSMAELADLKGWARDARLVVMVAAIITAGVGVVAFLLWAGIIHSQPDQPVRDTAPMNNVESAMVVASIFGGIWLVMWAVETGWWSWGLKMAAWAVSLVVGQVLFGSVGFWTAAVVGLALTWWPKVVRWNDRRALAEASDLQRRERMDRVLKVFESRLNG